MLDVVDFNAVAQRTPISRLWWLSRLKWLNWLRRSSQAIRNFCWSGGMIEHERCKKGKCSSFGLSVAMGMNFALSLLVVKELDSRNAPKKNSCSLLSFLAFTFCCLTDVTCLCCSIREDWQSECTMPNQTCSHFARRQNNTWCLEHWKFTHPEMELSANAWKLKNSSERTAPGQSTWCHTRAWSILGCCWWDIHHKRNFL